MRSVSSSAVVEKVVRKIVLVGGVPWWDPALPISSRTLGCTGGDTHGLHHSHSHITIIKNTIHTAHVLLLLQPSTTCHRHHCHQPNQSPLEPPLNGFKTNNWLSCAIPPFAVIQHRMWLLCLQDLKTARGHHKAGGIISIWVNGCHRIFLDVICALTV